VSCYFLHPQLVDTDRDIVEALVNFFGWSNCFRFAAAIAAYCAGVMTCSRSFFLPVLLSFDLKLQVRTALDRLEH
jgi:hypothetical protein